MPGTNSAGSVSIPVRPDATGFGTDLKNQILSQSGPVEEGSKSSGEKSGKSFADKFKSGIGSLSTTISSSLGAFAVGSWLKGSFDDLAQSSAGVSQTAAVIKSTGGAAGVTATQIDTLTNSLKDKTATDDDVIRSGANMLLTFTNVRNEAGKGNDIFNQATGTLMDMSRAMGTDPKNAAIQLGKALNDPVAGISALSRVGVTFDETQKKQIAGFMKAGDTASAQKVILGELNKEFGGQGAAYADSYAGKQAKLQIAMDDLGKSVAQTLMPALQVLADVGLKFFTWVSENPIVAAIIGAIAGAFVVLNAAVAITNVLMALNPFVIVAVAVVALIAAIVWLATQTTFFQDVWKVMSDAVMKAISAVGKWFNDIWNGVVDFFKGIGKDIQDAWNAVAKFFGDSFKSVGKWFSDIWDGAKKAWDVFSGWIHTAVDKIAKKFSDAFQGVSDFIGKIFGGLAAIVKAPINVIIGLINSMIDSINGIHVDIPAWVPGIGGKSFGVSLPHIPALAEGGIVPPTPGGRIVRVAEAGEAEAIIPLSKMHDKEGKHKGMTIHYHAAPNDSISAEQKLIDAVQRARVLAWT